MKKVEGSILPGTPACSNLPPGDAEGLRLLGVALRRSAEPAAVTGLDGIVWLANPALATLCGEGVEHLVGRMFPLFSEAARPAPKTPGQEPPPPEAKAWLAGALREESTARAFTYVRPNGTPLAGTLETSLLRDATGGAMAILCRIRTEAAGDVTEKALQDSTALLQSVINASEDAIVAIGADGLITIFNPAAERMFQRHRQDVIGTPLDGLMPEAFREAHRGYVRQFFGSGKARGAIGHTLELPGLRADGTVFPMEATLSKGTPDGGAFVVGVLRDISERKRAESALAIERNLLRTLIDHMPDLIFVKDPEGRFIMNNAAHLRILGVSAQEHAAGKTDFDFFPPELARRYHADEQALAASGRPLINREEITVDREGHRAHLLTTKVPILGDDGRCSAVVGISRDITDRKHAEEALRDSEEKFRLVTEAIRDAFWLSTPGLTEFIYISPAFEEIWGRSRDVVYESARAFLDYIHPEDRERMTANLDGHPSANWTIEYRIVRPNGEIRWVRDRGYPVFDSEGKLYRMAGVNTDITARRQAEQALRESEERFRLMAENLPGVVYLCRNDARYTMLHLNAAVEALTGYAREEFLADQVSFVDLYHPEDADRVVAEVDAALAQGDAFHVRYRLRQRSGAWRWIEEHGVAIRREGQIVLLEGFLHDITDRILAEEQREKLERQIQQAQKLESLGVLAGGIAHDFNNLLMGVLGNASMALVDLSPLSPSREHVFRIQQAAQRAAELTSQLLAYSGKGRFIVEPVDLSILVEEMAHLLQVSISKKAVLRLNLARDLPATDVDATQVRQVVINLITNASEAIGDKSGLITITTGAMTCDAAYLFGAYVAEPLQEGMPFEGSYVFMEVSDTGCGMDKATLARIFDPFFTTKFTGRGLGLAAVLGIVRGHRAALKVYSEPGRGSTFKVLFPASPRAAQPARQGPEAMPDWRGSGIILVVDDEEMVRSLAQQVCERAGFTVIVANDGREALEVFRERAQEIRLVLLDLTMPHMSGEETFRELRRIRSDARVILSSGYTREAVTSGFAGKGLAGFIQKPYKPLDLLAKIREALEA